MRKLATIVVLAMAAGSAAADTVRMEFEGVGSGRNVRVSLGSNTINCFAGQLVHSFSNGTGAAAGLTGNLTTFCSDLTQSVTSSGSTYTVTGIQNLPGSDPMGSARAQAIYDMYAAAGGSQMGSDADMAAAFQLAIWEVVYDYNPADGGSLNLAAGDLRAKSSLGTTLSSSILSRVSFLFGAIGSNALQAGLMGFRNGSFQDQILQVQLVPVPLAAVAGLLGLGVAGYMRKRTAR
jgi:hypothetical protein